MANFKKRHAIGKPQIRKKTSDYRYPQLEHGFPNRGKASTRRKIESVINKVRDYFAA